MDVRLQLGGGSVLTAARGLMFFAAAQIRVRLRAPAVMIVDRSFVFPPQGDI